MEQFLFFFFFFLLSLQFHSSAQSNMVLNRQK
jgi:hypothetical protein